MKNFRKLISFLICIVLLVSMMSVTVCAKKSSDDEMPVVVSLGDSYSSGEGIQPFYGQSDKSKYTNEDWISHRSTLAWSGMLEYNGKKLNRVKAINPIMGEGLHVSEGDEDGNWYFAAASGAVTYDVRKGGQSYDVEHGKKETLKPQIDVVKAVQKEKNIDYITMTIGGNDVGFVDIIIKAGVSTILNPGGLRDKLIGTLNSFWNEDADSTSNRLKATYTALMEAAPDATIVVAGYPQLLHCNEDLSGNGGFFNYVESRMIDDAVFVLDGYINQVVNKMNSKKIVFVDVQKKFENHEAYAEDAYIEGLKIGKDQNVEKGLRNDIVSSASFHPNYQGACAYASAVQEALAKIDSGFAEIYYNTDSKLELYGDNGNLYDNCTVKITGKEHKKIIGKFDFFGLWKKDFSRTINVTKSKSIPLKLPKGDYVIKVIDNDDTDKIVTKPVHIRNDSENKIISIPTNFGYKEKEVKIPGKYESSDVLSGAVEFNNHWYKVIDDSSVTTWDEAKRYCENSNGYLATITSKEENDFLYNYLTTDCGYENAYFGLTDKQTEDEWKWDNGEEVAYTNWNSNEPNSENSNENYAMFYYEYPDGTWNDGDFEYYDNSVFICEWGEYTAKENVEEDPSERQTSDERDVVLALDVSSSMSGNPLAETKKAATEFINTVLDENASVAIVTYDSSAQVVSDFSMNKDHLLNLVDNIYSGGSTNIDDGLAKANDLLQYSNAKKKIIVLMSDGEPTAGRDGEELIEFSNEIKKDDVYIYTLGFFGNMGGGKSSAQELMEKLASEGCHYEVSDAENLKFFFGDIAEHINGQKYIYIRIACPVDVTVSYNGETLCSAEDDFNARTDFGTLTLEDIEDSEDKIKTLRLKEGNDYSISIEGTGRGKMNYTIGYMDDNGKYSDKREFRNIAITKRTVIDTSTEHTKSTILNVDEDGDGKYDLKYKAGANERGELVDYTYIIYIVAVAVAVIFVLIMTSVIKKKIKNKNKREVV